MFVLISAYGIYESELTKIAVVRVRGVPEDDRPRVASILQRIQRKPALQIDAGEIESAILATKRIRRAVLARNVFGRARLWAEYRKPVARWSESEDVGIDAWGVAFRTPEAKECSLVIQIAKNDLNAELGITLASPLGKLAQLAQKVQEKFPNLNALLFLDQQGRLCLNIKEGSRVILGNDSRLDEKLERLKVAWQENPQIFAESLEINVVEPRQAVFVPRGNRILQGHDLGK
ncbi:MAG: cell division protein FtsQ/DivIB [Candidatus Caldarchaeum sp.]